MGNRIVTGELFRAKTIGAELEPRQIWCWSTCQLDVQRRDYHDSCFGVVEVTFRANLIGVSLVDQIWK